MNTLYPKFRSYGSNHLRSLRSVLVCASLIVFATTGFARPRIIISTDPIELNENYRYVDEDIYPGDPETGDPDDLQSLVRFLLYSNEFEVEGIIASSERIDDGRSKIWVNRDYTIHRVLDKYDEVDENLRLHDPYFPTASYLKSKVRKGYSHPSGAALPGPGKDNPGTDLIIEAVDSSPEPLWFLDWVGQPQQFEISQAIWTIRQERSPEEQEAFLSKLRMVSSGIFPGGPGGWLRDNFPDLFLVGSSYIINASEFSPRSWMGMSQHYMIGADAAIWDLDWANQNLRQGHGPLGALFPTHTHEKQPGVADFDSRTFLFFLPNGLSDPNDPSMGNWGGRYYCVGGRNHWAPAEDDHPNSSLSEQRAYYAVGRYQHAMQADFQARMDWCVMDWNEANHNPVAVLNGDSSNRVITITTDPGEVLTLSAEKSSDPDGDPLSFHWWVYREAGSCREPVVLQNPQSREVRFTVPPECQGETLHIILEVQDQGSPPLTSYRRCIVKIR